MRRPRASTPEKDGENTDQHTPSTDDCLNTEDVTKTVPDNSSKSQENNDASEEPEKLTTIVDAETKRGAARKHHWKSQSVGDSGPGVVQSKVSNSVVQDENFQEHTTFSANRELWQRRATSQTHLNPQNSSTPNFFRAYHELRDMRQKHTPDLVMDLPLSAQDPNKKSASTSSLSSSDEESPGRPPRSDGSLSVTGPESPDMSTAAERFAKQNQCTLKKNTKGVSDNGKTLRHSAEHESEPENGTDEIIRSTSSNQISEGLPLRSPVPSRSTPKIVAKFADMHLTGGSQIQVSSFKPQVKVKPTILRKPIMPYPHPHMSPELARKIEKQAQSAEQAN